MSLTRRGFIVSAAAAVAAPAEPLAPGLYLYGAESFITSVPDAPFIVGLLLTHQPEEHIRAIRQIKQRIGYRGILRYHSSDRGKISFARELLHYFIRFPDPGDLRFFGGIVTPSRPLRGEEMESYRIAQYPRLFKSADLARGGTLRLIHHRQDSDRGWDPAADHSQRVTPLLRAGFIAGSESITKKANDGLIELNSLLCGDLLNEVCNRSGVISSTSRAKLQIIARHRQLHGGDLAQPNRPRWQPVRLDPI
jgi:hypothetical protein